MFTLYLNIFKWLFVGRHSQYANQKSDTYNMTVGGTRPYEIRDKDGNVIHQEESLGKDLFRNG